MKPECKKHGCQKRKSEYFSRSRQRIRVQWICQACRREQARERYKADPQRHIAAVRKTTAAWKKRNPNGFAKSRREVYLRYAYGITAKEVDDLYSAQGGRCAGCRRGLPLSDLQVDHCHKKGGVRGLLCRGCNLAVGNVDDNALTLQRLAHYLSGDPSWAEVFAVARAAGAIE